LTIAEIKGKISSIGTNLSNRMEDLLTSDVFGAFRYLPADLGLIQFLKSAVNQNGQPLKLSIEPTKVNWSFWPWLEYKSAKPCEPDVVIGLEDHEENIHVVLVESKYFSNKSSLEDDQETHPTDQLARELHNLQLLQAKDLGWPETKTVVTRSLLYVTQDTRMPLSAINDSLKEFRKKRKDEKDIYWTSWRFLPKIMERIIEHADDEHRNLIISDLMDLLLRKQLTLFLGMTPLDYVANVNDFRFYTLLPAQYVWTTANSIVAPNLGFYKPESNYHK
jgi:hypothetical protein